MSADGPDPRLGDLVAAARACMGVAEHRRRWVAMRILHEAGGAARHMRRTGRMHPRWGDGSVMAAALRRDPVPEPPLCEAGYRACLALCLDVLNGCLAVSGRTS